MFLRLLFESFRRQKRRKSLALLAIALGMSIATAMIAVVAQPRMLIPSPFTRSPIIRRFVRDRHHGDKDGWGEKAEDHGCPEERINRIDSEEVDLDADDGRHA